MFVHSDLCGDNILLTPQGELVIVDFADMPRTLVDRGRDIDIWCMRGERSEWCLMYDVQEVIIILNLTISDLMIDCANSERACGFYADLMELFF